MATCLLNLYNGIENIFKRILNYLQISLPTTKTVHRDLLELAVKQNIISQELPEILDEYWAFRHFFIHGYGIFIARSAIKTTNE